MLKFKEIQLKEHYAAIGRGMQPGYQCTVTLQHGDKSYDTIRLELSADAVRDVIALAASKAVEQLSFDADSIRVEPVPGELREEEPAPPLNMPAEPMVIATPAEEIA